MALSVGLMLVVLCIVGASLIHTQTALASLFGGTVAGVGISVLGYRLTRFEVSGDGKFYTPNACLGIALTLLLVARLLRARADAWLLSPLRFAGAQTDES
jgi:hypothetical protein